MSRLLRRSHTAVTPFQRVEIWKSQDEAEFRVTGATHAWWHRQRFLTGLAWDNIAAGVLCHTGTPRRLLMLGLGGGTSLRTLRHLLPDLEMTAIEIDPDMITLAREHMEMDAIRATIVCDDAYGWLRENRQKFDVIVDDVYAGASHDVVRPGLYTPDLRRALFRSLAPDGCFCANLVTGEGHRTMQSAFRSFYRSNFPRVRSVTTPDSLNETLIGTSALRPWREVRQHADQFAQPRDRMFWHRLRSRSL